MNEIVIQSLNTIKLDVQVDKILYENYKGSGVLIATKSGATGQAKVNGGPIIMPNVDAYEFLELAPTIHAKHLTMMAPLIIKGDSEIDLNNFYSNQRCDLIIDGMKVTAIKSSDHIHIRQIDASFKLCFPQKISDYIDRLQQTFIRG
jgi:NAD+ kinase